MKPTREELSKSLEANLPKPALVPIKRPNDDALIKDNEEEYKYARTKLKSLIDKSEQALDTLMTIAQDAEHPRAYEVLSAMLKNTADITDQLMKLQKQRKELVKEETPAGGSTTTNNTVFLGSTTELQKFLKQERAAIDIL
jgi:hypothetical protein